MSDTRPVLPIYALLLAAVGGAGTLLFEAPFESVRPSVDPNAYRGDTFIGEAPTRLWQDPLGNARTEFQNRETDASIGCAERMPLIYPDLLVPTPVTSDTIASLGLPHIPGEYVSCPRGPVGETVQTILKRMGVGTRTPASDNSTHTLLLPVMVTGGYDEEDAESRRRTRYAVLTALMSQGFSPIENRYIGYFVPRPTAPTFRQPEDRLVAFEVLNKANEAREPQPATAVLNVSTGADAAQRPDAVAANNQYVAVLWMPELLAREWPPAFFSQVPCLEPFDLLGMECSTGRVTVGPVIGPASSETLIELFRTAAGGELSGETVQPARGQAPTLPEVTLISTAATISPARMQRALGKTISPVTKAASDRAALAEETRADVDPDRGTARSTGKGAWKENRNANEASMHDVFRVVLEAAPASAPTLAFRDFVPVLSDDETVADTLIEELEARGVDIFDAASTSPSESVAIIGEVDRVFTKTWLDQMIAKVETASRSASGNAAESASPRNYGSEGGPVVSQYCRAPPTTGDNVDDDASVACLLRFQYFGGLDGAQATRSKEVRSQRTIGQIGVSPVDPELLARSIGDSQFDYLRRLADEVKIQHDLLRRAGGDGIRAIGVFGSDVYDKILILQALQQELPNTLFFTNDLDARLLHPANYRWTRNLIVASAYGLDFGPARCRSGVAPFRDSYQTASYVGTLIALDRVGLLADADPLGNCQRRGGDAGGVTSLYEEISHWSGPPRPRLFEIARNGAVDITPGLGGAASASQPGRWFEADFGPPRPDFLHYTKLAVSIVILGMMILVLTGRLDRYQPALGGDIRWLKRSISAHTANPLPAGTGRVPSVIAWARRLRDFPWARLLVLNVLLALPIAALVMGSAENLPPGVLALLGLLPAAGTFLVWWRYRPGTPAKRFAASLVFGLFVVAVPVIVLGVFYAQSSASRFFEPAFWLSGVSTWPTEVIRIMAFALGVFWLVFAYRRLDRQFRSLHRRSFADPLPMTVPTPGSVFPWDWGFDSELQRTEQTRRQRRIDDSASSIDPVPASPDRPAHALSERSREYAGFTTGRNRTKRTLLLGSVHAIAVGLLFATFGAPPAPARGIWALAADVLALLCVVPLTIFAAMFVTDATRICSRLVQLAANDRVAADFSAQALSRLGTRLGVELPEGVPDAADGPVREYARLDFIAEISRPVGKLIRLPFALIALLVISRSNLFDQWGWSIALVIAILSLAFYSLLCAIRLRKGAEEARNQILDRLGTHHRASMPMMAGNPPNGLYPDQIRSLIDLVREERRGAFNGWFKHPIVQAMLLPFGGAGAVALLDFVLTT